MGFNESNSLNGNKFIEEVKKEFDKEKRIIHLDPKTAPKKSDDGGVLFLAGKLAIGEALKLEALFGVMITNNGFATQFQFNGKVAQIIELDLNGFVSLSSEKLLVSGSVNLELFNSNILSGKVDYDSSKSLLTMDGDLNLCIGSFMSLKGSTKGIISGEEFDFNGKVDLIISDVEVGKAKVTLDNSKFHFTAKLFEEGAKLELLLEDSEKFKGFKGSLDVDYRTEIYVPVPDEFSSFGLNPFSENVHVKLHGSVTLSEENKKYICKIDLSASISSSSYGELTADTFISFMPTSFEKLTSAIYNKIEEEVEGLVLKGFNEVKDQFDELAKKAGELVDDIDEQLGISDKADDAISAADSAISVFNDGINSINNWLGDSWNKLKGLFEINKKKDEIRSYNNDIRDKERENKQNRERIKTAERKRKQKEEELVKVKQRLLDLSGMEHTYLRAKVKSDGKLYDSNSFVSTEAGHRKKTHKWGHNYPNLVNFAANGKSYITGQSSNRKHFWIYEMSDEGELGRQAYSQTNWDKKADTIVVFDFEGSTYFLGLSIDKTLFIRKVLSNGKLDKNHAYAGKWDSYYKKLVTFSVGGKVFIAGQNEQGYFSREILRKRGGIENIRNKNIQLLV